MELAEEKRAKELADLLTERLGEGATVRLLGDRRVVKIRGMDVLVEINDILTALECEISTAKEDREQTEIIRMFAYSWQEKVALVKAPLRTIKALLQMKTIAIGWTRARVIDNPEHGMRCWST